jgi:hypothetical protein
MTIVRLPFEGLTAAGRWRSATTRLSDLRELVSIISDGRSLTPGDMRIVGDLQVAIAREVADIEQIRPLSG